MGTPAEADLGKPPLPTVHKQSGRKTRSPEVAAEPPTQEATPQADFGALPCAPLGLMGAGAGGLVGQPWLQGALPMGAYGLGGAATPDALSNMLAQQQAANAQLAMGGCVYVLTPQGLVPVLLPAGVAGMAGMPGLTAPLLGGGGLLPGMGMAGLPGMPGMTEEQLALQFQMQPLVGAATGSGSAASNWEASEGQVQPTRRGSTRKRRRTAAGAAMDKDRGSHSDYEYDVGESSGGLRGEEEALESGFSDYSEDSEGECECGHN